MNKAQNYPHRLELLERSIEKNSNTGEEKEVYEHNDKTYWARVEINSGSRDKDGGMYQTGCDATIYIRNYPYINAVDRLYHAKYSETWIIEDIRRGDNEYILSCHKYDESNL